MAQRQEGWKDSVENLNKAAKNDGHLQEERQSEVVTDELTNKKPDTKKLNKIMTMMKTEER